MLIVFYLSVEAGRDMTEEAKFLDSGILQFCLNEKPRYPIEDSSPPELESHQMIFNIPESYPVCNLYNLIQHWINPEDHILVHNGFLVSQFQGKGYNTLPVTSLGIKEGSIIHCNRVYQTWKKGDIRLGTLYESGDKYFIRPDGGIIKLPDSFPAKKESTTIRESWEPFFRNLKFIFKSCQCRGDNDTLEQIRPLVEELEQC